MPIQPGVFLKPISQNEFHEIDYEVMGIVFSIHQDFGRFWNEKIYRNELADRCQYAHGVGSASFRLDQYHSREALSIHD